MKRTKWIANENPPGTEYLLVKCLVIPEHWHPGKSLLAEDAPVVGRTYWAQKPFPHSEWWQFWKSTQILEDDTRRQVGFDFKVSELGFHGFFEILGHATSDEIRAGLLNRRAPAPFMTWTTPLTFIGAIPSSVGVPWAVGSECSRASNEEIDSMTAETTQEIYNWRELGVYDHALDLCHQCSAPIDDMTPAAVADLFVMGGKSYITLSTNVLIVRVAKGAETGYCEKCAPAVRPQRLPFRTETETHSQMQIPEQMALPITDEIDTATQVVTGRDHRTFEQASAEDWRNVGSCLVLFFLLMYAVTLVGLKTLGFVVGATTKGNHTNGR